MTSPTTYSLREDSALEHGSTDHTEMFEAVTSSERGRLVRLCAGFAGDIAVAEDLAQETLYEAWRNRHKLHDPAGLSRWLSVVARNVCLRWAQRRSRDPVGCVGTRTDMEGRAFGIEDLVADPTDLEVELEREDLVDLLDRALALLPADTRAVLVERYVHESPHAEIAGRLGLSEGAVKLRLHRGRLALSRVLTTDLTAEAAAYGLVGTADGGWQETRIWCVVCGARRLLARSDPVSSHFTFRCPTCNPQYLREHSTNIAHTDSLQALGGVKSYKPALRRIMDHAHSVFAPALGSGVASCPSCGQRTPLRIGVPEYVPRPLWTEWEVHLRCDACGYYCDICLAGLVLWRPEGQQFWRKHPRLRLLPERVVEVAGQPAILTSYESATDGSRYDAVSALHTFRPLDV